MSASNSESGGSDEDTKEKITNEELQDSNKRKIEEPENDEWVGPLPSEAVKTKKRKVLEYEQVFLHNLPSTDRYERSYMHRDALTHVAVAKSDFIITTSIDGHVKFWKKKEIGIEFVKHFRAHLKAITCMAVNCGGELMCTVAEDQAMKVFDVINFDMINMIKLGYTPSVCEWIMSPGSHLPAVAVAEKDSGIIRIYDGRGTHEPLHVLDKLHGKPVTAIKYDPINRIAISCDRQGMLEYWFGQEKDFKFPSGVVKFKFKTDTDLYELAKNKTYAHSIATSPNGAFFACLTANRKAYVFHFLSAKLSRVFNESLNTFVEMQQSKAQLANMEFGRRIAVERELEKLPESFGLSNLIFDETSNFLMYGTMFGVKLINLHTNRCVRFIGKSENIRILHISLYQGAPKKRQSAITVDMKLSDNPGLQEPENDPTLFCTAYKKNRFYMFTKRAPDEIQSTDGDRDVFNEKPSKEEVLASMQVIEKRVSDKAIIHTTVGDVHIKLFMNECPKTVENFCVHSRDGYYNGHIFHRVIKGFMIQTGDPLGSGTGGESIWGGEFEDEFHPSLRHDRPYTLSMANAGPNTNGSQFFVTVVPTPWLDNKHTVFGRVVKGMDVIQNISLAKTHPKTDKPYDDISIVNVSVK
uniref:peptidylprolyl isomerase domain and WD repeat-containing protein 1-like n=2 Tax=Styela clava TaxID=7725 RepID=UPI001939AF16|nr:peptidylprolyl isomerase domain and WD repeat-containing protein 1-like [Styela clava]